MAAILYVHWNEAEAREQAAELAAAGHTARCHWSAGEKVTMEARPDALVVSLDRLPSHGRAVAEWFRGAKKRRGTPLVFVGGAAEKVAGMRERFPDAPGRSPRLAFDV